MTGFLVFFIATECSNDLISQINDMITKIIRIYGINLWTLSSLDDFSSTCISM